MGARRGEVAGRSREGRLAGTSHGVVVEVLWLLHRCVAVRLSVAEVVGGREVELGGRGTSRGGGGGPRVGRGSEARRAGLGARRRGRRLLEVGESARLGAVGITVCLHLLVAGEAELVVPEIEGHGGGWWWVCLCCGVQLTTLPSAVEVD